MSVQILDIYAGNKFDPLFEKASGTDGVIVKAGQGHAVYDMWQVEECKKHNIPYGVYWLVDARYSPEGHKAAIKRAFPNGEFGPLGIWLDVEKPTLRMLEWVYRKLPYAYYKPVESIAVDIISHYGVSPGIYTSPGMYNLCFGNVPLEVQKWFAKLPLWTAQYKTKEPSLYGAWERWMFWQYQGEPDYSVFNGDENKFKEVFSLGEVENQKPSDEKSRVEVLNEAIAAIERIK